MSEARRRREPQNPGRCDRSIAASVQTALRQDRLLFAYQPVVCAATGEVDYFECLLRMRDAERGLVACGEFVAAVERAGLIGLIDRYVLERVAEELAAHPEVRLGLNVSGLTACDRSWLRSLMAVLRRSPEFAGRLVIEITETAALANLAESARFVETLRHAGCRVALDDFGAGHTSLRHLQVLAVDTIKIDGDFVRHLPLRRESRVFLRHLLGLTRGFGFGTVAECVETGEEAQLLLAEGIGFMQGFHFGRPTTERVWLGEGDGAPACGFGRRRGQ
jgi:EAL domain-containing protein (putative c-di-GMP-specific phosphodiesterase class I)